MFASFSTPRLRALVRFAGGALCVLGFFLPMFTESTPGTPSSAHPVYEWQVVTRLASSNVLASALAVFTVLGVLIVLSTSVATWFTAYGPRLALLNDLAATWGLAVQFSLDFVVLQSLSIGAAHSDIASGFVLLLIGFLVIFGSAVRLQTIFTPLTSVLLAIGSVILGLAWVFFDFFGGMVVIDVSGWLPLLVLLGMVALFMTRPGQWATTALTLPLVLVSLYGLYYLLLGIGALAGLPASIKALTVGLILLLLNSGMVWLTRKPLTAGKRKAETQRRSRRSFLELLTKSTASVAIGGLFVTAFILCDPSKASLLN